VSNNSKDNQNTSENDQDTSSDKSSTEQTPETIVEKSPLTIEDLNKVAVGSPTVVLALNLEYVQMRISSITGITDPAKLTSIIDIFIPLHLEEYFNNVVIDPDFYKKCGLDEKTVESLSNYTKDINDYIRSRVIERDIVGSHGNAHYRFTSYSKYANVGKLAVLDAKEYELLKETKPDLFKKFLLENTDSLSHDRFITLAVVS
jgi:hypothetical protein